MRHAPLVVNADGACPQRLQYNFERDPTHAPASKHNFAEGDRVRAQRRPEFPDGTVLRLMELGLFTDSLGQRRYSRQRITPSSTKLANVATGKQVRSAAAAARLAHESGRSPYRTPVGGGTDATSDHQLHAGLHRQRYFSSFSVSSSSAGGNAVTRCSASTRYA